MGQAFELIKFSRGTSHTSPFDRTGGHHPVRASASCSAVDYCNKENWPAVSRDVRPNMNMRFGMLVASVMVLSLAYRMPLAQEAPKSTAGAEAPKSSAEEPPKSTAAQEAPTAQETPKRGAPKRAAPRSGPNRSVGARTAACSVVRVRWCRYMMRFPVGCGLRCWWGGSGVNFKNWRPEPHRPKEPMARSARSHGGATGGATRSTRPRSSRCR